MRTYCFKELSKLRTLQEKGTLNVYGLTTTGTSVDEALLLFSGMFTNFVTAF